MKKNNCIIGYVILLVVLVGSIVSIIVFGNKGASLVINIFFALLMFGILLIVMYRNIHKFVNMISDLKNGANYFESLDQLEIADLKDGYSVFSSNEKLAKLLTAYYKENSGFDGDIADYINEDILEEEINKHVSELAAGAMTGLGLLGTFWA